MNFEKELAILINKYSKENESDTPNFILAQYLKGCLANYAETVKTRGAAIRAEVQKLPRKMLNEIWRIATEEAKKGVKISDRDFELMQSVDRYGYSIKEE